MDWKRVTPIPLEFNGYGYLYECKKCHKTITYLGKKDYPPFKCNCCKESEGVNDRINSTIK